MNRPRIAMIALAAAVAVAEAATANRTIVRNDGPSEIGPIELVQTDLGGRDVIRVRLRSLGPGESATSRHHATDFSVTLRFVVAGREFTHESGYIDLWSGEGWVFAIGADGSVDGRREK